MKTTIETSINFNNGRFRFANQLSELNDIIELCTKCPDLDSLMKMLNLMTLFHFIYGKGAGHIWVSFKDSGERILLVTE